MALRKALCFLTAGLACLGALHAFQRPFREYPGIEYNNFPLPSDHAEKTEWAFARLMYPSSPNARFVRRWNRYGVSDWTNGNTSWTQDYPRADRHFSQAIRRLTRLHVRSTEQPVNLDDADDVFNWPWLYAVQVGEWELTDAQVKTFREYLMRGGFFMCDDFWGTREWDIFAATMKRVFPDRAIVEIDDRDAIFHTIYDLDDRYQVPGARYIRSGTTEKCYGCPPHWRGIYDDRGRVMVAICFDSDLGDSWEWADEPQYEERFSALGIRIGVNYVVYAMTH
jgi:hypothetical protein